MATGVGSPMVVRAGTRQRRMEWRPSNDPRAVTPFSSSSRKPTDHDAVLHSPDRHRCTSKGMEKPPVAFDAAVVRRSPGAANCGWLGESRGSLRRVIRREYHARRAIGKNLFSEGNTGWAERFTPPTVVRCGANAGRSAGKCRPREAFAVGSDRVGKVVKLAGEVRELEGFVSRDPEGSA